LYYPLLRSPLRPYLIPYTTLFRSVSSSKTNYSFYLLDPVVSVATGLKWMYNYNKGSANKKNISNSTANYIGIQTKYSFSHPNALDRKSTRLNSSHVKISYAVFCLN